MVLVLLSCLWVAGIYLGSLWRLPPALGVLAILPAALFFYGRRYAKPAVLACLGIVLFFGAAFYSYSSLNDFGPDKVSYYNDSSVARLRGMIAQAPDVRDTSTRLLINSQSVDTGGGWRQVSGRVLVLVRRYPEFRYGDVIEATGEMQTPPQLDNFDYRGYLAHQGIFTTMEFPGVSVLEAGQGLAPLAWIYDLRTHLASSLAAVLPEPQASLAQGIVVGVRGNIPTDLNSDFSRSGTAHILAISGQNLAIIAGIILGIGLAIFGRRRYVYIWLALGTVWIYTLITGLMPPVVRGAIMVSIFLLAEAMGRQRSAMVALTAAAAVMVGLNPRLLGDASFQMTFLAMAGLVFIFPLLRDAGRRAISIWPGEEGALAAVARVAVDSLSVTLAAILAVWPVVAYYFGIVSRIGPLATFLVLPALPAIIVVGGLAAMVGLASLAAAQVIGWVAWPFLTYLMVVVRGLGATAAASVSVGQPSSWLIGGYYLGLAVAVGLSHRWRRQRLVTGEAGLTRSRLWEGWGFSRAGWFIGPLLGAAVLTSYTAATLPEKDLRVSFLDVGEGDAILIQQGSRQVLIDGGPSPQAITLGLSSRMPFWDRTIDVVVLTHPHQDHLAGLLEVLRRYRVGQALYPAENYTSPVYDEWKSLIAEKGIRAGPALTGQCIMMGDGVQIDILLPAEPFTGTESDIDNNGVVLRVSDGEVSFLLTADIMQEAELELVHQRAGIQATVLKVAHHGSETSSTPGFLASANPEAAVISCGAGNSFGHPNADVVKRLDESVGAGHVFRTDEHGTIDFFTDGMKLKIKTEK